MAYTTIFNGVAIDSDELDVVEKNGKQKRLLAHARGDVHIDLSVEQKVQQVLRNRQAAESGNTLRKTDQGGVIMILHQGNIDFFKEREERFSGEVLLAFANGRIIRAEKRQPEIKGDEKSKREAKNGKVLDIIEAPPRPDPDTRLRRDDDDPRTLPEYSDMIALSRQVREISDHATRRAAESQRLSPGRMVCRQRRRAAS
jgi:hypothetical protein